MAGGLCRAGDRHEAHAGPVISRRSALGGLALAGFPAARALAASVPLSVDGVLMQGGWALGHADPAASLTLDFAHAVNNVID